MAAPFEEMGYQLKGYVGTAGQQATTQLTNATDLDYDIATQKGATTSRGTGGLPPITTENVTQRGITITFTLNDDPDDSQTTTLLAAAAAGSPISFLLKTGNDTTLFDGDVNVDKKLNAPLSGPATYDFTLTPTKQSGRAPTLG